MIVNNFIFFSGLNSPNSVKFECKTWVNFRCFSPDITWVTSTLIIFFFLILEMKRNKKKAWSNCFKIGWFRFFSLFVMIDILYEVYEIFLRIWFASWIFMLYVLFSFLCHFFILIHLRPHMYSCQVLCLISFYLSTKITSSFS